MVEPPATCSATPFVFATMTSALPELTKVADAVLALLWPCDEVNAPGGRVLVMLPTALVVTSTDNSHCAPELMLPPLKVKLDAPATAFTVPAHVPDVAVNAAFAGEATNRPAGRLSTSDAPVSATPMEAGLLMKTVRRDVPPGMVVVGEKAVLTETPATTVAVAEAADTLATAPCAVIAVAFPAGMVLVCCPTVVGASRFTATVHDADDPTLAPSDAPDRPNDAGGDQTALVA